MKRTFYYLVFGLLIIACDQSDEDTGITDAEGLSVDLSWDGPGEENRAGIGLVVYDPENTLLYHNYDSATIANDGMDGQFVCDVEVFLPLDKTHFKLEVQGIKSKMVHTFKYSFNLLDRVGHKKTVLLIKKNKNRYTVELP